DREKAIALLKELYSVYDKAVKIGFIHRNTASRKKSKITKRVNQQLQAQGQ
ncbi:MAG TPA: 30S ribosomal protein S20, partial [candidate division WOR-3 bacterium]|nr:30S ribosomal protein S20 [candidate division WOR-3 bacterium]